MHIVSYSALCVPAHIQNDSAKTHKKFITEVPLEREIGWLGWKAGRLFTHHSLCLWSILPTIIYIYTEKKFTEERN